MVVESFPWVFRLTDVDKRFGGLFQFTEKHVDSDVIQFLPLLGLREFTAGDEDRLDDPGCDLSDANSPRFTRWKEDLQCLGLRSGHVHSFSHWSVSRQDSEGSQKDFHRSALRRPFLSLPVPVEQPAQEELLELRVVGDLLVELEV